jgi:hypothetical protein
MSAKPIKHILESAPEVRGLTIQTRRLLQLQKSLRAALPAGVAPQVSVTGLASGTLSVSAANGAAAAKLRQLAPRLLDAMRHDEAELNALRVLVQVPIHHNPLPKKQIFLGHTAREALLTLSARLESEHLRSAIIQLANRGTPLDYKQETLEEVDSDEDQREDKSDQ